MAKTCIWIAALVPFLALQAAPANAACKWKNGEQYCHRTSHGSKANVEQPRPAKASCKWKNGEQYCHRTSHDSKANVEQPRQAKASCKWKNGEQYCHRTSHGPDEPYTDARKDQANMKSYLERRRQMAQYQRDQQQAARARYGRWTNAYGRQYYGRQ